MQTKFSEDVIPLSGLKVNPGKVVKHAKDTHQPVLVTSRGRGIAVVQGLDDLKNIKEYYLEQGVPHIGQDFVASILFR